MAMVLDSDGHNLHAVCCLGEHTYLWPSSLAHSCYSNEQQQVFGATVLLSLIRPVACDGKVLSVSYLKIDVVK